MTETGTTTTFDPAPWEEQLISDLRANGGRPSGGPLAGHPLMLLYATGAKSGQRRRSILTYSRDGDAYIVAGTAGGSPTTPAWVANVRTNPDVEIEAEGTTFDAAAEVIAGGPERDRLWAQHVAQLPWFGDYESKVTSRTIPIVRLTRA